MTGRGGGTWAEGEPAAADEYVRALAATQPALFRLAQALCLAPYATPAFVRRARLAFVPGSAAGLEADLWFSPLVESADVNALVLAPDVAAALRANLACDPERWARVLDLTEDMQAGAPELARRFTRLAVADAVAVEDIDVDAELTGFRHGIAAGAPDGAAADDLARWLVHFLPRLPRVLAGSAPARTLVSSAANRLDIEPADGAVRDDPAARGLVAVGVRVDDDGLTLSRPPEPGARVLELPGGERIRVALAGPGDAAAAEYAVEVGPDESVHVPVVVFADLLWTRVDEERSTERRLFRTETVFGAKEALADWPLEVVSGPKGDGTELRIFRDGKMMTKQLEATARLLRVDGRSGLVLLHCGCELAIVRPGGSQVWRISGLGEICDALMVGSHAVVASESGVWIVSARDPSDKPRKLSSTAGAGTRICFGVDNSELVIVSAAGELEFVEVREGGASSRDARFDRRPITAMTGGRGGNPLYFAQTGPHLVRVPGSGPTQVVQGGGLTSDLTSLAITSGASLAVAADGRLLAWDGDLPDSSLREVPLPFRPMSVSGAGRPAFTVVGRGGPIELRAADGRAYLLTPRPRGDADTDWLRDTVVGTMPVDLDDLAALSRLGVGCVCLPYAPGDVGPVEPASFLRAAEVAGVKVLVDVVVNSAALGEAQVEVLRLMRYCGRLLAAGAAGVRVVDLRVSDWVDGTALIAIRLGELMGVLCRFVEGYPGRVLVLDRVYQPDPTPWREDETCHLLLREADLPERIPIGDELPVDGVSGRALRPFEFDADVSIAAYTRMSTRLAQPGFRALAALPPNPSDPRIAALLHAHTAERALSRGAATRLPTIHPDVFALLRSHRGEFVLCVANLAAERRVIALTTPSVPVGTLVDLLDAESPRTERIRRGAPTMLALDPYEYRWFRLLTPDELYASRP
ncbi:hypothetical protein [Embleya sp. AB8]|uniref:hypothetical protein n=1 Tax=Embleya sp. AB8 TaxID=3156304 RepID=UPI003C76202B